MSTTEMRKVLREELEKYMSENENIVVIDADLSKANGLFDLRKKFPDRAFDVGIAEQNMACIAAGMSSYGFIPFISTFTPFATRRICDQIAISICYAKQNVKIIGTDPGICAELNGGTHMSVEDIGVLRSIPDIVIFEPADATALKKALPEIIKYQGPVYMRMPRKNREDVYSDEDIFDLFSAYHVKEGKDVSIFCSGIMVSETIKANEILEQKGISADIYDIHTVKPIDKESIIKSARITNKVVTVENHNVVGGLYSAVAEVLSNNYPVKISHIGIEDRFGQVGKIDYLKEEYKMTANDIVLAVENILK